jgi:hypothetical protein
MIIELELERTWKEMVVAQFEEQLQYVPGWAEGNYENPQFD